MVEVLSVVTLCSGDHSHLRDSSFHPVLRMTWIRVTTSIICFHLTQSLNQSLHLLLPAALVRSPICLTRDGIMYRQTRSVLTAVTVPVNIARSPTGVERCYVLHVNF